MTEERQPTSHERASGQSWDASYQDGPAPWEIGRPQPAVVRLGATGDFAGPVLDAGCGSGDNGLHVASLGVPVLGFDVAQTAVEKANAAAAERGLDAQFVVADALQLDRLARTFATVLDCALFHTFDSDEQSRYAESLASVTEAGGTLYLICFADKGDQGDDLGPHPVTQEAIRAAFDPGRGWRVESIEPERLDTRFHPNGAPAWLAKATRL